MEKWTEVSKDWNNLEIKIWFCWEKYSCDSYVIEVKM